MDEFTIERQNERPGQPPTHAWMSINTDEWTLVILIGQLILLHEFGAIMSSASHVPIVIHEIGSVGVFFLGSAPDEASGKSVVDRISRSGDGSMADHAARVIGEILDGSVTPAPLGPEGRRQLAIELAHVWSREVRLAAGTLEQN